MKIDGTIISLGGQQFIVPALNIKALRANKEHLEALKKPSDDMDEFLSHAVPVLHAALLRNYADLKVEDLEEWVDLNNVGPAVQAVMGQSGLVVKGDALGEAQGAPAP